MIFFNNLGFVHIPKTGGTSVRHAINNNFSCKQVNGQTQSVYNKVSRPRSQYHDSIRDHNLSGREVFTTIRNPYAWYVSYYFYIQTHRGAPGIIRTASKKLSFRDFTKWMFDQKGECHYFNWDFMNQYDIGAFSWLFFRACARELTDPKDMIIGAKFIFDIEDHEKICQFLNIKDFPHKIKSNHDFYMDYYDDDLINLISERDRYLFRALDGI